MNKRSILILLAVMFISSAFAGDFDDKGVISGWKFAPVQVDVGLVNHSHITVVIKRKIVRGFNTGGNQIGAV